MGAEHPSHLSGADRELRGELLAAVITGIAVLRGKVGTRADRDAITGYVDRTAAIPLQ
ncbi:hypothetical protein [Amycolatopsis sp. RTGN1]|uniref:hypothetical protein n=1 Tax=Amycolatopsis ponsaeliensis TaxID=2992142 RepID=UPI00255194F6|nr:hypothetical protein [Amycolatopsis sp. RTGN1]